MQVKSRKVIPSHKARFLGSKIASKAMEHVIKPLETERRIRAELAYREAWKRNGISDKSLDRLMLSTEGEGRRNYYECCISFGSDRVEYPDYWHAERQIAIGVDVSEINTEGRKGLERFPFHKFIIHDQDLIEKFRKSNGAYVQAMAQLHGLRDEMIRQIDGKTVKEVCEAWPEAAEIVCQEMNTPYGVPTNQITTPLSQLLAKFLPALPAPAKKDGKLKVVA